MSKTGALKLTVRLLGIFVGVLLIFLLLVPLLGPGWHVLYGDFISYDGWRIPVPKGFYVRQSPKGPTMWKYTIGVPFLDVPYGHISLYSLGSTQRPFSYDRDYTGFEKGVIQEADVSGYQLKTKRTVSVGQTSGYCLEFTRRLGKPQSLLRCVTENSRLVFFYEGNSEYVPDALATLQGMSLEGIKGTKTSRKAAGGATLD